MAGKWTDEILSQMRGVVDPPADKVVAEIIESHGREKYDAMLKELINNRDAIPASMPKMVHDFFEETARLPEWANPAKIEQGEKVFAQYGPEMVAMLFFVSLPSAYAMQKGANVLAITAQLTKRVHRRIFRTGQFITDVMQPGGLGPNGKGIRSAQKLRLIHASIRYYMAREPKWYSAWGEPINQEDMAETLLDFSVGVIKGVRKLGLRLTSEEAEAYLHAWKVVGHIIGLHPKLQPENVADASALSDAISAKEYGESDAGKELAKDLVEFLQGFMPRMLRSFPTTAIRYLSGAQVANIIKTGPYNWTLLFMYFQIGVTSLLKFFQNMPELQKYIRYLNWTLMHKVVLYEEGSEFYFDIPDELRVRWQLPVRKTKARLE